LKDLDDICSLEGTKIKGGRSSFLLQGEAAPGVDNGYIPFPKYDGARHMPFKGCEAWQ